MPYFDASLYRYDEPQPSWWEADVAGVEPIAAEPLETRETCEVAIIGGGYTGLSAALHLARDHAVDVRVLEAGHIGWGASGRNGGFCCMGGTMVPLSTLLRKYGAEETRRYYQYQAQAVELVRAIASDENIDLEETGSSEMVVAEKPAHYEQLARESELQRDVFGLDTRMIPADEFRETCYDAPHQHGAMAQAPGFGLHPLKYCLGLARAAQNHGAILHSRSEVSAWEKTGDRHLLNTASGGQIEASHVIVACNGFMPEKLHMGLRGRAMPLQSQIIVTRPLSVDELSAHRWKTADPAINSRNVYCYYRMLPNNRFMIGGRADFHGTPQGAEITANRLLATMHELWPEWRHLEWEHMWRGFVCFTRRLTPSIGRLPDDPSVYLAFGYHGNGVNNATMAGREIARWLATGNDRTSAVPQHLPAILRGISPRFPLPGLRRLYTQIGIGWHRFKDMLD